MAEPTARERELALAAIERRHPQTDVVKLGIGDAYAEQEGARRVLYLEPRRTCLAAGDAYTTWVVTLVDGEVVAVETFVSRACRAR